MVVVHKVPEPTNLHRLFVSPYTIEEKVFTLSSIGTVFLTFFYSLIDRSDFTIFPVLIDTSGGEGEGEQKCYM